MGVLACANHQTSPNRVVPRWPAEPQVVLVAPVVVPHRQETPRSEGEGRDFCSRAGPRVTQRAAAVVAVDHP